MSDSLPPPTHRADHWCGWCRENPDRAAIPESSAVTNIAFVENTRVHIWAKPGTSRLHIHDAVVTELEALTVRAAVKRLILQKRHLIKRLLRKS